mgnify:CR=1 FL=1
MSSSSMSIINFVPKGWGYEKWIVNKEEYCGKLLFFVKDKCCSWHYHKLKDETFYIHKGLIELSYGWKDDIYLSDVIILKEGDTFHIPPGLRHQMYAWKDTELFEFSTEHFDEDSYRIIKGD